MYIKVNQVKLYYEVMGEGKALIMVHGNGEDHTIFLEAAKVLSKDYQVYLVDSRCHGKSDNPKKISYELLRDDYISFIKELKLEKPIFYGFSDGGIIGLEIALKEEDLLDKLIISGANLKPCDFKWYVLYGMKLAYLFNKSKLYKLMISEPNISLVELNKIKTETVVLAGSKDMVKTSVTKDIAMNIKNSKLEILKGESHGSYIVNKKSLANLIKKYL